ncbi:unnamed protein product [Clavelina lepadiformis]|uniref:Uncharacterized protein n=1 Tax=Clavelina lepadiformis TaxID=159417 RepID=A0ABP0GDM9_CLALP
MAYCAILTRSRLSRPPMRSEFATAAQDEDRLARSKSDGDAGYRSPRCAAPLAKTTIPLRRFRRCNFDEPDPGVEEMNRRTFLANSERCKSSVRVDFLRKRQEANHDDAKRRRAQADRRRGDYAMLSNVNEIEIRKVGRLMSGVFR